MSNHAQGSNAQGSTNNLSPPALLVLDLAYYRSIEMSPAAKVDHSGVYRDCAGLMVH